LKTYDAASFYVCTLEEANTNAIGKLWVEYDVELCVPQIETSGSASSSFGMFNLSADQGLTTATEATLVWDETVENSLSVSNSSGELTLPKGAFLVSGEVSIDQSNASVVTACQLDVQLDGAALSPPVSSFFRFTAAGSGTPPGGMMLPFHAYVESDGTNVLRVRLTATFSAGTVTAVLDQCRICIRPI